MKRFAGSDVVSDRVFHPASKRGLWKQYLESKGNLIMKTQHNLVTIKRLSVLLLILNSSLQISSWAQGTAFTYQGRLVNNGSAANGTYDFRFRVASDADGNNLLGGPSITNGVTVANGLFTVVLDFGGGTFTGSNRWLQVEVRTNGGAGYTVLSPLQLFTPSPYAIMASSASNLLGTVSASQLIGSVPATQLSGTVPAANISGTYTGAVSFSNPANVFSGNGSGLTGLWKLAGNSGTSPGANFLGTTDNQPLELKVSGARGLRLEPNTNGGPNFIGGSANNLVGPNVVGATICGGGAVSYFLGGFVYSLTNEVLGDFGTTVGGYNNVASGFGSVAMGGASFAGSNLCIAMGSSEARGNRSVAIGSATTTGDYAVALGNASASGNSSAAVNNSLASGPYSFAAGDSLASGDHSTALVFSTSAGNFSLSAGQYARAYHDGSFVWADRQNTDFTTFADNQFLIRASGGVGIGTNRPAGQLHVVSTGNSPQLQITQLNTNNFTRLRMNVVGSPSWEMDVSGGATPSLSWWTGSQKMILDYNGNLAITGTYSPSSDRNAKEHFQPVDPRTVLAKVTELPITRWKFKQDAQTEHIGPMAQDFYAAFGTGADDKHIATVDADGVALAAIQGLNQKVDEKDAEIRNQGAKIKTLTADVRMQQAENAELKARLERLEKRLDSRDGATR